MMSDALPTVHKHAAVAQLTRAKPVMYPLRVQTYIGVQLNDALNTLAALTGRTVSEVIRESIALNCERRGLTVYRLNGMENSNGQ